MNVRNRNHETGISGGEVNPQTLNKHNFHRVDFHRRHSIGWSGGRILVKGENWGP